MELLLILLCSVIKFASAITVEHANFDSPCPEIFEYNLNELGNLYGVLHIKPNGVKFVKLIVELAVENIISDYKGDIVMETTQETDKVIHYKVNFPYWEHQPPKVSKVLVNDGIVCSGPNYLHDSLIVLGINYTIGVVPLSIQFDDFFDSEEEFDATTKNPRDSFIHGQNIGFKPKMPRDPTKIYAINPFFSQNKNSFQPSTGDQNTTVSRSNFGTLPFSDVCGKSIATNSLIVHGSNVPEGALPWLVAMYKAQANLVYQCSGSLISNKHTVTAAHCVKSQGRVLDSYEIIIRLGALNMNNWSSGKILAVEKVLVHPEYEEQQPHADLAIVFLQWPVKFTKSIRPICLWFFSTDLELIVNQNGIVAGWGKDEKGRKQTDVPFQLSMPIVNQETCRKSADSFKFITSNRTFCAGSRDGKGPCNGDSGSGLIIKIDGKWVLRGLVSMSLSDSYSKTCDLNNYIVFTDVSKYTKWVTDIIL